MRKNTWIITWQGRYYNQGKVSVALASCLFLEILILITIIWYKCNSDSAKPQKVKQCHENMPLLLYVNKLITLVPQRCQKNKCQQWRNDKVKLSGTLPLMNDKANCRNGLLLFSLDKYSDKWSALIIPSVFVPECHRHCSTRYACRMRQAN